MISKGLEKRANSYIYFIHRIAMFFSGFDNSHAEARLSGNRFSVIYRLSGNEHTARAKAIDICAEQTVEFPVSLLPPGVIPEQIVGQLKDFRRETDNSYLATISFAEETAAGEFTQFLNVIFGNISMKSGIQVTGIEPSPGILALFPGPQFGIAGIRKIIGIENRPPLFTALKPMGLSAENLARLAEQFVEGGIDIIKDYHGLSDQPFAPFAERVERCAAAVREANVRFGRKSIFVPNITAPADRFLERAHQAKELGAGGVMVTPGLTGLDALRQLAAEKMGLPIFAHPAFIGNFVMSREQGISAGVLFGTLMRLAGADATIYPNYGGRFPLSIEDCMDIVRDSREPFCGLLPIFPCPAGGMELKNIQEMVQRNGNDMLVLVGSGLFRCGDDLVKNCRRFLDALNNG
jgi:ribulose-bisphosphate carboxylase large chain